MGKKLTDDEKWERDIQKAQDKVSRIFHKLEPIREAMLSNVGYISGMMIGENLMKINGNVAKIKP